MKFVEINEQNPQSHKLKQIAEKLKSGAVIIYPTDSVYAFGCDLFNQKAIERICKLKGEKVQKTKFSFICKDISQLSEYARQFDNNYFKLMKKTLPGPYTYILNASKQVPKIIQAKKKTVGIRVPDNNIALSIVEYLGNPLITSSIKIEDPELEYKNEPWMLADYFQNKVDLIIDGGTGGVEPTTVLDCTESEIEIIRLGKGDIESYL